MPLFKVTVINPEKRESHEIYVAAEFPGPAEDTAAQYARIRYHSECEVQSIHLVANKHSNVFPPFIQ